MDNFDECYTEFEKLINEYFELKEAEGWGDFVVEYGSNIGTLISTSSCQTSG